MSELLQRAGIWSRWFKKVGKLVGGEKDHPITFAGKYAV
jgi:hypothetical protein